METDHVGKPQGEWVVVFRIPECSFCNLPACFDFKTWQGPWAYGCLQHFILKRGKLGVGRGQALVLDIRLRSMVE